MFAINEFMWLYNYMSIYIYKRIIVTKKEDCGRASQFHYCMLIINHSIKTCVAHVSDQGKISLLFMLNRRQSKDHSLFMLIDNCVKINIVLVDKTFYLSQLLISSSHAPCWLFSLVHGPCLSQAHCLAWIMAHADHWLCLAWFMAHSDHWLCSA